MPAEGGVFRHFRDQFLQWTVFAAPPLKDMHPFIFQYRAGQFYLYAQFSQQAFTVNRNRVAGCQLRKGFVGDTKDDVFNAQGRNSAKAAFTWRTTGI